MCIVYNGLIVCMYILYYVYIGNYVFGTSHWQLARHMSLEPGQVARVALIRVRKLAVAVSIGSFVFGRSLVTATQACIYKSSTNMTQNGLRSHYFTSIFSGVNPSKMRITTSSCRFFVAGIQTMFNPNGFHISRSKSKKHRGTPQRTKVQLPFAHHIAEVQQMGSSH